MKNERINVYIRPMTLKELNDYCDIMQYDKSRAVDELLYGRLAFLKEAREKAKKANKFKSKYDKCFDIRTAEEEEIFEKWCKEKGYNPIANKNTTYTAWNWATENPRDKEKENNEKSTTM